jgi:hypothetical protein
VPEERRFGKIKLMKNIKFLPQNVLGKWSVALVIAMPVFFFIGMSFVDFYESVSSGKTILQDIMLRPGVALAMLSGFASGITALFTGAFSILKKKERSVLVFISTTIGLLVLLFLMAEVLFPH